MPSTINADNGVVSGSAGLKSAADSSGVLQLQTNGTTAVTVDTSQNVGIGTTSPSSFGKLAVVSATNQAGIYVTDGTYAGALTPSSLGGMALVSNGAYPQIFYVNGSERMRIDSSGNVGIGTSSPGGKLDVFSSAAANVALFRAGSGQNSFVSVIGNGNSFLSTSFDMIQDTLNQAQLVQRANAPMLFFTNNTERARISSGGGLSVYSASISVDTIDSCNNQGAGTTYSTFIGRYGATGTGNGTVSVRIYTNGNIVNTNGSYGAISDAKMKTDIVDAGSQWDDIKAIRFRKFKIKDDPSGRVQLGVVAQELEQVSPGLIDETPDRDDKGNDLGTITKSVKTSVLLMKAAVALQEAMARIEKLESQLAAKG